MAEQIFLGRYKVMRLLDEGGMSRVYLARKSLTNQEVVVKVLKPEFQGQSKPREHFRREIHIMSLFKHPNSVQYIDSAPLDPNGPVLVMEYLRGVDLGILMHRQGRFTPARVGRLLGQLCDVLQAAHDAGVIHRDIKPGNLWILSPGTPEESLKLMDYGLAKMVSMLYLAPDELVNYPEPAASGTPEYISPEEVRGTPVEPRSDIYSVGVVLYELLAGRRPFEGTQAQFLMRCHEEKTPPTFSEIGVGQDIPKSIEDIVRACLSKQPDQRPRNALELALQYEQALGIKITQHRRMAAVSKPLSGTLRKPNPMTVTPAPSSSARLTSPRNGMQHSLEADMPEALAMVKLKGFVYDLGGEVVESVPGKIRVRLADPNKKKSGLFSWLGGGDASATATASAGEIEIHTERRDPTQPNKLTITLVINPSRGLISAELRERCKTMGRDLHAYLMGRS